MLGSVVLALAACRLVAPREVDAIGEPALGASASVIEFGEVTVDCAGEQGVTLQNAGGGTLEVEAWIDGGTEGGFSLEGDAASWSLGPGETVDLPLSYRPAALGTHTAELVLSDSEEQYSIFLSGTGVQGPWVEETATQADLGAIDLLLAVDSSGSMDGALSLLVEPLGAAVGRLVEAGHEPVVGVITLDVVDVEQSGRLQALLSGSDPEGLGDAVSDAVAGLGISGASDEHGLDAVQLALDEPLRSTDNAGFGRPDASLVTVLISDEDDQSDVETDTFLEWYEALRAAPGEVRFNAVAGPFPGGCTVTTPYGVGISAYEAPRYAATAAGSGGAVLSFCALGDDDFDQAFDLLASGRWTDLALVSEPVTLEGMTVTVDGVPVEMDLLAGWTWDGNDNRVEFHGEAVPARGSEVKVGFRAREECTGGEE